MSEIAVKLTEPELAELVISAVEAFQYSNGPYLEHEHRAIARELGHNEGRIERLWRKAARQAYNDLAAMRTHLPMFERFDAIRPKIEEAKRKVAGAKVIGFDGSQRGRLLLRMGKLFLCLRCNLRLMKR
jgi:hypothetical protein